MKDQIRIREADVQEADQLAGAIQEIYSDRLDAAIVRNAFPKTMLDAVTRKLDSSPLGWNHPNRGMPGNEIEILGTDTPATPTYLNPRGAALEAYLSSASAHEGETRGIFPPQYDVELEIRKMIGLATRGLPAELAVSSDGRKYVPFTLRRLGTGQEISLHHDSYFQMPLYGDLARHLDHATLISFLLTVQTPDSGGKVVVYALRSDDPAQPRLPGGRWNSDAIQSGYPNTTLNLEAGHFLFLASGRYFHRVEPVAGPRPRITLGGFLGLTQDHSKVLYWS